MATKVCTHCTQALPNNTEFFYLQSGSQKTRAQCKTCTKQYERNKGWPHTSVNVHRTNDRKDGIYCADTHITEQFLLEQYAKQQGRCMYPHCQVVMSTAHPRQRPDSLTVERLCNWNGHSCDNCVLVCMRCQRPNKRNKRRYSELIELLQLDTPIVTSRYEFKRLRRQNQRRPSFV